MATIKRSRAEPMPSSRSGCSSMWTEEITQRLAASSTACEPEHGCGLLHFIGRNAPLEFNPWVARHIFPGAHAAALSEVLSPVFESAQLSILDLENLRPHYALTLRHWLD